MSAVQVVQELSSSQASVRQAALQDVLCYTSQSAGQAAAFKAHDNQGIRSLVELADEPASERTAVSALVNLTYDAEIRDFIASDRSRLDRYASKVCLSDPEEAGLYSMLLANLAHSDAILSLVGSPVMNLLNKFCSDLKGAYDYLGFAFAELARRPKGGDWFAGKNADMIPIAKLYPQFLGSSVVRRRGSAATVKNSLFDVETHAAIAETGVIEYVMLALKGPEDMDKRDAAELPSLVQESMGPDKVREPEEVQQLVLVEILLLLSSSPAGRTALRSKKAYYVVRELHLASKNAQILDACVRFVNMVMRGEPDPSDKGKLEQQAEDDDEITEVI